MSHATIQRINVNFPKPVLDDLRRYVPRTQRSQIIARATERELRRIKLSAVFDALVREPAWLSREHLELSSGPAIDAWIARQRAGWAPARKEARHG
jgi:hypothetical protein